MERELLAIIAETLHALVVITLKANGAKGTPPPLQIPRPGHSNVRKGKPAIRFGDYLKGRSIAG